MLVHEGPSYYSMGHHDWTGSSLSPDSGSYNPKGSTSKVNQVLTGARSIRLFSQKALFPKFGYALYILLLHAGFALGVLSMCSLWLGQELRMHVMAAKRRDLYT